MDNLNAEISKANFQKVVRQFHQSNFCININLELDGKQPIITPAGLKSFLIDKCGGELLFSEANGGPLSDPSRCNLVDHIAKYVEHIIEGEIKQSHKIMAARAAIHLFPNFRTDSEEGYVSVTNYLLLQQVFTILLF